MSKDRVSSAQKASAEAIKKWIWSGIIEEEKRNKREKKAQQVAKSFKEVPPEEYSELSGHFQHQFSKAYLRIPNNGFFPQSLARQKDLANFAFEATVVLNENARELSTNGDKTVIKAQALFNLADPDSIKVLLGPSRGGIEIRGLMAFSDATVFLHRKKTWLFDEERRVIKVRSVVEELPEPRRPIIQVTSEV